VYANNGDKTIDMIPLLEEYNQARIRLIVVDELVGSDVLNDIQNTNARVIYILRETGIPYWHYNGEWTNAESIFKDSWPDGYWDEFHNVEEFKGVIGNVSEITEPGFYTVISKNSVRVPLCYYITDDTPVKRYNSNGGWGNEWVDLAPKT
jgi:hypothetical protein